MQISLGCRADVAPSNLRDIAMNQLEKLESHLTAPGEKPVEFYPGFLHGWNRLEEVFAENLGKLKSTKDHYDPRNRFNKSVDLMNLKAAE